MYFSTHRTVHAHHRTSTLRAKFSIHSQSSAPFHEQTQTQSYIHIEIHTETTQRTNFKDIDILACYQHQMRFGKQKFLDDQNRIVYIQYCVQAVFAFALTLALCTLSRPSSIAWVTNGSGQLTFYAYIHNVSNHMHATAIWVGLILLCV